MSFVRIFALFPVLLLALLPMATWAASTHDSIPTDSVLVEIIEVIDGDTFDADFDPGPGVDIDRVRMIGIDTPETSYSFGNEPECFGDDASQRTKFLLDSASQVYLERDEDPVDPNDRLLRYVWYVSASDGEVRFLNEQLVEEGYAEAKTYQPNVKYQDRLDAAESRAVAEGAGMWSACDLDGHTQSGNDGRQPETSESAVTTTEQSEFAGLPDLQDLEEVEFVDIIDGDTFDVDYDPGPGQDLDRIRMIGIDTPETSYAFGNEPECYGKDATGRTESLLVAAERIFLESDVDPVDPNDRLLRYVWYVSGIDGKVHFLNEQLVEEGYALAKTYEPNTKYQKVLDNAELRAISEGRGLWTECDASVSLDPSLETDGEPDSEPVQGGGSISGEDASCSFFDNQAQAQEFLDTFPEMAPDLDPDKNDIACDGYFT